MSPPAPIRNVPRLRPPEEVRLKRRAMSTRELRRAEVLAGVKDETLRLVDAAKMLELNYRQMKRLWKRYRGEGAQAPAPQRGKRLESGEARDIPAEDAAAAPGEVFGDGTGAVWTNAGRGTFSRLEKPS
jgi:hypothetical protein